MPTQQLRAYARLTLFAVLTTTACATPPTTSPTVTPRPDLAERIHAAGYEGVFVVLDPGRERLIVSDPIMAERRYIPASTFKIPNSLIALELGVADSPNFALKWDGVERWVADWNRDHDMRSAFAASAVWYYQEIARRIGEVRMAEWLVAADYGNADISGGVDTFWLNGGLRISPHEQVEFLQRLHEGKTPFAPAVVATFLEGVMLQPKTGWARAEDFSDPAAAGFAGHLGWYVGAVEQPDGAQVYFATLLLAPKPAPESFVTDRRALTESLLAELGDMASNGR